MLSSSNLDAEEFIHGQLKENFDQFMKGGNNNTRIPASVIRNNFAHGSLTPSILKAKSSKRQKILDSISIKLLEETEQVFSNWVDLLQDY